LETYFFIEKVKWPKLDFLGLLECFRCVFWAPFGLRGWYITS